MFIKVRGRMFDLDPNPGESFAVNTPDGPKKSVYYTVYLNPRYILRASPLADDKTVEIYHNDGETYYYDGTIDQLMEQIKCS